MSFDASEIIALIVGPPGKPPDQPRTGFVVDRVKRAAKLQAEARILYRPYRNIRATPAPGPPEPRRMVPSCCPRCALPTSTCCCPTR